MDVKIEPYFRALEATSQEQCLGELTSAAEPIIRRTVGARLAGRRQDMDDVCSEARLELLVHLRRIKSKPAAREIDDFFAYVGNLTRNTCHQYFRARRLWRVCSEHTAADVDIETIPAPSRGAETSIDQHRYAARVWQEIRQLPRPQRVALLLNLRDGRGNSILSTFSLSGVASFAETSATFEISEARLAEIWIELPWDDNTIARFLGCSRQQVINLRMSARKRLSNRLGARPLWG